MCTDIRIRRHTKKRVVKICFTMMFGSIHYAIGPIVVKIWNSLPNDVITATSVNSFKSRLDTVKKFYIIKPI